jgi:site-specific DNA recombinase
LEEHYQRIQLDPNFRENVEKMIGKEFRAAHDHVASEQRDMKREREKLERQGEKLMEAHYAGAIPVDLLGREQERIGRALEKVKTNLAATQIEFEKIEQNLHLALDLTVNCGAAFKSAPEHIKRLFNQAFFEKVLVIEIEEASGEFRIDTELQEPFEALLNYSRPIVESKTSSTRRPKMPDSNAANGLRHVAQLASIQSNSFSNALFVEVRRFELRTPCMPCKCSTS